MSLTCEASWPCLEYRRLARPPYSKLRFQSALLSRRNRQKEANRLSLSLSDSVLDSRSEMSNSAASREASIQASTLCVFWEVTQDDKRARALSCQKGTKGLVQLQIKRTDRVHMSGRSSWYKPDSRRAWWIGGVLRHQLKEVFEICSSCSSTKSISARGGGGGGSW